MTPTHLRLGGALYVRADKMRQPIIKTVLNPPHLEVYLPRRMSKYIEPGTVGVELDLNELRRRISRWIDHPEEGVPPKPDLHILIKLHLMLQSAPKDMEYATVIFSKDHRSKYDEWFDAFTKAHESAHVVFDRLLDQFELTVNKDITRLETERAKGRIVTLPASKVPWRTIVKTVFTMLRHENPKMALWDDLTMMQFVRKRVQDVTGTKSKVVRLWEFPITNDRLLLISLFIQLMGEDVIDSFTEAVGKKNLTGSNRQTPHEIFADLAGYEHVTTKMNCPKYLAIGMAYSPKAFGKIVKAGYTTDKLLTILGQPKTYADLINATVSPAQKEGTHGLQATVSRRRAAPNG